MDKKVMILAGAGQIGMAIARRMGYGMKIIVGDKNIKNAEAISDIMNKAGFDCVAVEMDLSSRESIKDVIAKAQEYGEITMLVNAAGVSPSQAHIEAILKVDLYGTAVLLEEVGKVIAEGGTGVTISSQSGHRMPTLTPEQDRLLAMTPTDELLSLPMLQPENIENTLHAYQMEQRCGVLEFDAIKSGILQFPIHRESFYCFILVEEGETVIFVNGIRQNVGSKTIICGLPGEIWEWKENPAIKGKVVIFEPDFIMSVVIDPLLLQRPGFLQHQTHNPFIPLSDNGYKWIRNVFVEMMEEVSYPVKFNDLFRVQLWHLILLIEKEYRQNNRKQSEMSSRNYAMSFINLVGVEFYRHYEVEYYAERLCITTNYLNKISHSTLGVSAREYIQGRIINEAKNLLDITGMNVSEISNTLGFNTTNYFIRFFKKHTGVTPGDYRNKAQ